MRAHVGEMEIEYELMGTGDGERLSLLQVDLTEVFCGNLSGVNYTLSDMAGDTAGLIEVLGLSPAHVVGDSMGGMIPQRVATVFRQGSFTDVVRHQSLRRRYRPELT